MIPEKESKPQLKLTPYSSSESIKELNDSKIKLALKKLSETNMLTFKQAPKSPIEIQQEKNEKLLHAVKTFKEEEILTYLKDGADPNYVGDSGLTSPLVHIIRDSVPEGPKAMRIIKLLLQFGADPFITYGYNNNISAWSCIKTKPEHKISETNRQTIIQLFLECPANVERQKSTMTL